MTKPPESGKPTRMPGLPEFEDFVSEGHISREIMRKGKADSPSLPQEIALAAYRGDEDQLQKLTRGFEVIEDTDPRGISPLIASSIGGHAGIVRKLLEHGANPKITTKSFKDTALIGAAFHGHLEVASVLLDHAPELLNQANKPGYTPLMAAAIQGHEAMVRLLLGRGASAHKKTQSGFYTFIKAGDDDSHGLPFDTAEPFSHRRDSVYYTLADKINPDARAVTAIELAFDLNHQHIVEILAEFDHKAKDRPRVKAKVVADTHKLMQSSLSTDKEVVPDTISIAHAQTEFFTAVGIRDERLRGLVAGVVMAAVNNDEVRLARVQEALREEQVQLRTASKTPNVALSTKAPELYRDRPIDPTTGKRENIEQFLTRVYKAELDAGLLTEPALSRLDKTAYNVLRETKGSFPNLRVPSKADLMAAEKPDPTALRMVQRLAKRSYRERVALRKGTPTSER